MSFSEKWFDFTAMSVDEQVCGAATGLHWTNEPKSLTIVPGKGLQMVPKPGVDYWRRTFVPPPKQADVASGHALLYKMPVGVNSWRASTKFSMSLVDRYDQAGLMVLADGHHWLKTGIEFEYGKPCMSCVITNRESDWNFVAWPTSANIEIRVLLERFGTMAETTVEYWSGEEWVVLRNAPLAVRDLQAEVSVGLFCAAPKNEEGNPPMEAVFENLRIEQV